MNEDVYAIETKVENFHWWFVGRRALFRREIESLSLPVSTVALDIGVGTGANIRLLKELEFENPVGIDRSDQAIRFCSQKGFRSIVKSDASKLPFPDGTFGLILATDILEHIDKESNVIDQIYRVLTPGGTAILTVPAFPSLWGLQDEVSHHKRRYRMSHILRLLKEKRFNIHSAFHFNFILFVPIWLTRQIIRTCRIKLKSENQVNTVFFNAILKAVFLFDVWMAPRLRLPLGVSIFAKITKDTGLEEKNR